MTKPVVPNEDHVHKTILRWIRAVAPDVMVWHTPNGGSRHLFEAFRLKELGVVRGVPDICLVPMRSNAGPGVLHTLEIKKIGGAVQPEQKMFGRKLEERGARFAIVHSVEEARAAFADWGIPTREAIAA